MHNYNKRPPHQTEAYQRQLASRVISVYAIHATDIYTLVINTPLNPDLPVQPGWTVISIYPIINCLIDFGFTTRVYTSLGFQVTCVPTCVYDPLLDAYSAVYVF